MSSQAIAEIQDRITAVVEALPAYADEEIRPHLLWQLREVLARITLGELRSTEVVALLAVLAPAHSRILAGDVQKCRPRKGLKLVPGSSGA